LFVLIDKMIRPEEVEFFLRLHGLWEGLLAIPPPPDPPFDVESMEPIRTIEEWCWWRPEDSDPAQFHLTVTLIDITVQARDFFEVSPGATLICYGDVSLPSESESYGELFIRGNVAAAEFTSGGTIVLEGGSLTGDLSNLGLLTGSGHVEDVVFEFESVLRFNLRGVTDYDQITSDNAPFFDCDIEVVLVDGFLPCSDDLFTVFTSSLEFDEIAYVSGDEIPVAGGGFITLYYGEAGMDPHSIILTGYRRDFVTHYVDQSATAGAEDGSGWDDAYTDLQSAITAASAGEEIWVAEGTYVPGALRTDTFLLKAGVRMFGGFPAGGGCWDHRDPNPATNGTGLCGDNINYNVVDARSSDSASMLDGFTITQGNADGTVAPYDRGGGMTLDAASPRLSNLRVTANRAKYGGGLHTNSAVPGAVLTNVAFIANVADITGGGGGATYLTNGSHLTFTNCLFAQNSALRAGVMNGFTSDPVYTNCTFVDNSSANGAVFYGTNPTLINCIVWNNTGSAQFNTNTFNGASANNLIEGGYSPLPSAVIAMDAPQFVSTDNYRLMPGSPALDLGDTAANSTVYDLAGNARAQGFSIDLGPYEGALMTLATAYAGLDPNLDANSNGHSNFEDYAAGFDPTADFNTAFHAPSLMANGDTLYLTHPMRRSGEDVNVYYEVSTDLVTFSRLVEGIDFEFAGSVPVDGTRDEVAIELLGDQVDQGRMFYRRVFTDSP
jgi:hypothetical protein